MKQMSWLSDFDATGSPHKAARSVFGLSLGNGAQQKINRASWSCESIASIFGLVLRRKHGARDGEPSVATDHVA